MTQEQRDKLLALIREISDSHDITPGSIHVHYYSDRDAINVQIDIKG